jgi:diguanylate cyclase (GGDEF)-like protein/PAS domain S-box-containing protein
MVERARNLARRRITARRSTAARLLRHPDDLQAPHSVYRRVFEEAPVAIALLDSDLRIADANRELLRMLGLTGGALQGRPVSVLAAPPHPPRLLLMAQKAATTTSTTVVEHRYRRADSTEGWSRTSLRRIESDDRPVTVVCTLEDFTSDQIALEEQRREAEQDPLTGLLNRRGGDRRLRAALERMAQSGPVAVILCDADRFKEVNDRFGHAAGDDMLAGIAARLRAAVRSGDEVARIGGDEFIIVARVANETEAVAIAERCVAQASGTVPSEPVEPPGGGVTLSAGVAVAYPGGPVEPGSLLAAADRALYAAKRSGGSRWRLASAP